MKLSKWETITAHWSTGDWVLFVLAVFYGIYLIVALFKTGAIYVYLGSAACMGIYYITTWGILRIVAIVLLVIAIILHQINNFDLDTSGTHTDYGDDGIGFFPIFSLFLIGFPLLLLYTAVRNGYFDFERCRDARIRRNIVGTYIGEDGDTLSLMKDGGAQRFYSDTGEIIDMRWSVEDRTFFLTFPNEQPSENSEQVQFSRIEAKYKPEEFTLSNGDDSETYILFQEEDESYQEEKPPEEGDS